MERDNNIFDHHLRAVQNAIERFPALAANHARNFFDKSWTNKGFTDSTTELWKPVIRKGKVKERPLVQSGALRRSLRSRPGIVYTDLDYAKVHNEGGSVIALQTVREHTRKGRRVRRHLRMMAFKMPKRQFIGPSRKLEQELHDLAVDILNTAFNRR